MLLGELEIGGAGFLKTLQGCDKGFGEFLGKIGKIGAIAGGSFVAFEGIAKVLEMFKHTLDMGGELQDLSTQTGEAVGDLVILRQAFDNAGLGAENTGEFLLRLQDSISGVNESGKSTAGALKELGTSAESLRNLPAIGQIEALQKGFEKLDQTTRVQVAKDLFGKSGGKALSLLGDPEALDQARKQAGPLADIMGKNASAFDKLGDTINGLKVNFQEFFAGALSSIAPEATSIADALASIDFVGIGETVGVMTSAVLKLAEVLAGPLATAANFVSEALSTIFGSDSKASAGLADKYRGLAKLNRERDTSGAADKGAVSALQKIGGGGGFGGGDPLLSETRAQTRLLQRIADGVGRPTGGGTAGTPVPV